MSYFIREKPIRKLKKRIIIFTEGTRTEPIYFESKKNEIREKIRREGIEVEIKGQGYNTLSLVDFAISYIDKEKIDLTIDDCWVAFDKDDFDRTGGRNAFNDAITKAKSNNIKVAYSNESFELWLLLHFIPLDSAIGRDDYEDKLTERLKITTNNRVKKYRKKMDIYPFIYDKERDAIRNARMLIKQHSSESSFSRKNPSTTVYLLVEDLNKLK